MDRTMSAGRTIRIGCAAGFWGDSESGAEQLVARGNVDYLVFDYLAEITMSILARAKLKDPGAGYATDFVTTVMASHARAIKARGIKVVANAGGVNPGACRDALLAVLEQQGIEAKVAVVLGDDLSPQLDALRAAGIREMDRDTPLPARIASINAYLGARPIAQALDQGADIVITGRCVDSAIALGPLMHEFGWGDEDYDLLSAGTLAGHIIECGCQATGGVFSDWRDVEGWDDPGFPIAECAADGTVVITKPEGTGGLVSPGTVAEQLIYEIGDPAAYLMPDVCCDWTGVELAADGANRVRVTGARGRAPGPRYKVSATYQDGFRATTTLTLAGGDAAEKARRASAAILAKCCRMLASRGLADFSETSVEIVGAESMYGEAAVPRAAREVMLKIAVRHPDKRAVDLFSREVAPAITATAPGITGFFAGRPGVVPVIRLFSCLVDKTDVRVAVDMDGIRKPVAIAAGGTLHISGAACTPAPRSGEPRIGIPLATLAHARSGDKGDIANIGVIARKAEYVPVLRDWLTEDVVAGWFAHFARGAVRRYELPGIGAFNFLLHESLGGGGTSSLRIDPQGKCFAPIALDFLLPVPVSVARAHDLA